MDRRRLSPFAAFVAFVTLAPALLLACGSREPRAAAGDTVRAASASSRVATPAAEPPTENAPVDDAPIEPSAAAGECADDGLAARAVRVTLAHAERRGIAHSHLADCRFDAAHCGADRAEAPEDSEGARCIVDVRPMSGFFQIRVRPRALAGAPRWIDASLDATAADPPSRFYVGASTWATGRNPWLVIGGVDEHISHTHGGEPAHIGHAALSIRNGSGTPLRVTAQRVEWLTSGSCEVPSEVRAQPELAGLTLEGSDGRAPEVIVAPRTSAKVTVWFAPQPAYYSYCDRFTARVTLDVGGEPLVAVAEWEVSRRDPMRRDDR